MTEEQRNELIHLYVEGSLPPALRTLAEDEMRQYPGLQQQVKELMAVQDALASASEPRPSPGFVERALTGLIRANAAEDPWVKPARK